MKNRRAILLSIESIPCRYSRPAIYPLRKSILAPWNQLNNRDAAGRNVDRYNVGGALSRNRYGLIRCPLTGAGNRHVAQGNRGRYFCAAIDLGQTLLRLEHAVVVEDGHDPATGVPID